ncbi:ComEC/Rec2 family competence protein [Novosphingobium panipatense]
MQITGGRGGKARHDGLAACRSARCTAACHQLDLPVLYAAMGIQAAVFENSLTDASEAAALQHGPWTCKRLLSRGLAASERFLHQAGFEQGPWLSVAFGAGITAWFALPTPIWWAAFLGIALAFIATGSASFSARQTYPYLLRGTTAVVLIMAGGLSVAWVRSELVGAAPIERPISGVFEGRLLGIEPQPARGRDRLLLAMRDPTTDSGRAIKIRVNRARDGSHLRLQTGDVIRFQGRLMPPAPPMLPGAYNFARTAWFSGIAATGSVLGPVLHVERGRPAGRLAELRQKLTDHVRSRIGESASGLAAAFVTGDRGGIVAVDDQAMRDSGLAHLLSISGLHVSALVGAVYLLVLRLAALFPWLALRVRLPVLAAGGGALAGIGYTLISGAEVPTVRSCVGALLVLIALALGREPLSLRMLAVAAFCVMMLWPEAVMGPSFQMSFGAVLALVAISGAAPVRRFMAPRDEALIIRALRSLVLLLVTGIVIDLALMPIGLFHFHRAGVYGALANVVAIPLTTFIVMPLLAGALLLDLVGAGTPSGGWPPTPSRPCWHLPIRSLRCQEPSTCCLRPATAHSSSSSSADCGSAYGAVVCAGLACPGARRSLPVGHVTVCRHSRAGRRPTGRRGGGGRAAVVPPQEQRRRLRARQPDGIYRHGSGTSFSGSLAECPLQPGLLHLHHRT